MKWVSPCGPILILIGCLLRGITMMFIIKIIIARVGVIRFLLLHRFHHTLFFLYTAEMRDVLGKYIQGDVFPDEIDFPPSNRWRCHQSVFHEVLAENR